MVEEKKSPPEKKMDLYAVRDFYLLDLYYGQWHYKE